MGCGLAPVRSGLSAGAGTRPAPLSEVGHVPASLFVWITSLRVGWSSGIDESLGRVGLGARCRVAVVALPASLCEVAPVGLT